MSRITFQLKAQPLFNIVVSVVLVITALTAFTTLQRFDDQMASERRADYVRTNTSIYYHLMLSFCYERDIHPCDQVALEVWNSAHPNDNFTLRTPSQLGDESAALMY